MTTERPDRANVPLAGDALTKLIERLNDNPVGNDGMLNDEDTLTGAERDTIVYWLRVGRVLSNGQTLGAVRMFGDAVDIRFQFCSDVEGVILTKTLDEAESPIAYRDRA